MISTRRLPRVFGEMVWTAPTTARLFGAAAMLRLFFHTGRTLLANSLKPALPDPSVSPDGAPVTLLTFSIYPDLARIWYSFAVRNAGDRHVRILIVDCSGALDARKFLRADILRFWNFSHSRKIDYFLRHVIQTPYVWLCDDDLMITSPRALEWAQARFAGQPGLAVASLAPRGWGFSVNGRQHSSMGTYCILLDRRIFVKEALSFDPVRSRRTDINRGTGYYDTSDYANEQLLLRGYGVETLAHSEERLTCGFVGTSIARLLLLQGAQSLRQEVARLTPASAPAVAHRLVGAFCAWKVYDLYRHCFGEQPAWLPPLSAAEISDLAEKLPEEQRERTLASFERYQAHFQYLSNLG